MMKKVGIVVPVYNSSPYLDECLESIFSQSYRNFVIYAVNDGSTDDSLTILKKWQEKDSRLKVLSQKNGGVSSARNAALREISSEEEGIDYLLFIDSDDKIVSDCLKICIENIKDSDILVYSFFKFSINETKAVLNPISSSMTLDLEQFCDRYFHLNKWSRNISTDFFLCNKFFTYKLVKNVFFNPDLKIAEDIDFMIKILPSIQTAELIPDTLYLYRVGDGSLSHSEKSIGITDELKMYQKHLKVQSYPIAVKKGIQHKYLQKLWATTQNTLNAPCTIEFKREFYKQLKKEMLTSLDFPLTNKEKKRIKILRLGFSLNLLLAVFRGWKSVKD